MFKELLSNNFFRTRSLVTRWPDECISIEDRYEEKVPPKEIERAEAKKVTNLIVAKGGHPIGFVPVHVAKRTVVLKETSVRKGEQFRVSANLRLVELTERLVKLGTKQFPILFVVDQDDMTIGILNYSDLNRKSVYLYSYTLLLFLEHWVKDSVRESASDRGLTESCVKILSKLPARNMPHKGNRLDQLLSTARGRNQLPLLACDLKDLIYILESDEGMRGKHPGLSATSLDFAARFLRNRVAHPNNLLIPTRKSDAVLVKLHTFFEEMERFVRKHDINDKVRIYS